MKELALLGSLRSLEALDACIEWMAQGRIDAEALLDLTVPFADCMRALADARSKQAALFRATLVAG